MIDTTNNPVINQNILKYTLEELKAMKLLSNTNGRPNSFMTDDKWQRELEIRRFLCKPYDKSVKKMKTAFCQESSTWNKENGVYQGQTNWQQYCAYINDVLRTIENGDHDYCYFIYQIDDLLKFHRTDLVAKYHEDDRYFEVWLK